MLGRLFVRMDGIQNIFKTLSYLYFLCSAAGILSDHNLLPKGKVKDAPMTMAE